MAGAEGIEPSSAVLETDILPLNYAPRLSVFLPVVYRLTPIFCDTVPHLYGKSSGIYYKVLIMSAQVKSEIHKI